MRTPNPGDLHEAQPRDGTWGTTGMTIGHDSVKHGGMTHHPFLPQTQVRNGRSPGPLGKAGERAEKGLQSVLAGTRRGAGLGRRPGSGTRGGPGLGKARRQVPVRRRRRGAHGGRTERGVPRGAERRARGGAAAGLPGGNGVSSVNL